MNDELKLIAKTQKLSFDNSLFKRFDGMRRYLKSSSRKSFLALCRFHCLVFSCSTDPSHKALIGFTESPGQRGLNITRTALSDGTKTVVKKHRSKHGKILRMWLQEGNNGWVEVFQTIEHAPNLRVVY